MIVFETPIFHGLSEIFSALEFDTVSESGWVLGFTVDVWTNIKWVSGWISKTERLLKSIFRLLWRVKIFDILWMHFFFLFLFCFFVNVDHRFGFQVLFVNSLEIVNFNISSTIFGAIYSSHIDANAFNAFNGKYLA